MNTTELRGVLDRSMMNNDLKMFLARRIFQFAIENSKVPVCKKVYELQNMINGDKSDLIIRGFFTSILAELDGVIV